ncbi:MAG: UDP-N-acetylhexosamine pyrophosphorylase [Planctomycetaceae bacterium]|nr:UDP-N-acetylhexosamine pyrophosphorylase [Planctomycetaceae bacterium]
MTEIPTDLQKRLKAHGQEHVLYGWNELSVIQRTNLVTQLSTLNFRELDELIAKAKVVEPPPKSQVIAPLSVASGEATANERSLGEEALRRGEVAALIVAGGQGSRLGFDKPKGMFPVGPVSGASLFQIHAEKLLATSRRYGKPVLFLVMTSPATDTETRDYFRENQFFGLPESDVIFFEQGTMPAVCAYTGRLLLDDYGTLALSPNGHGGTITALAERCIFRELHTRGVKHIYYFQVDNPLLKLCDPGFIGRHISTQSEASSKVVFKERPEEKVGVFALIDGKCGMIEYSDLPRELSEVRESTGELRFRAGNPAIHLFAVNFLEQITSGDGLPYHIARKAISHFDPEAGVTVTPSSELNGLKFERFIFDALPLAERWLAVETSRAEEFSPLKNGSGADSPETVRAAQSALHSGWLERAGVPTHGHTVEISPLFALDEAELKRKLPSGFTVTGPTLLR